MRVQTFVHCASHWFDHGLPVDFQIGNSRLSSRAFAGLRVAVGILFLIFGEYKVFGTEFTLGSLSILDQSIPDGWRLPVYGTGSEEFCSSFREANCVSGRLRRIGDR